MNLNFIIYAQGQQRRFGSVFDFAAALLLLGVLQAVYMPYLKQYIDRATLSENLIAAAHERMLNVVHFSLSGNMADEFTVSGNAGFGLSASHVEQPILPDYVNGGVSQRQDIYLLKVSGTIPRGEIQSSLPQVPAIPDRGVQTIAAASQAYKDINANKFYEKRKDLIDQSVNTAANVPEAERDYFVSGGSVVFLTNRRLDSTNRPLVFELTVQNKDRNKFNSIWYNCGQAGYPSRGANATSTEIVDIESLCRRSGIR